MSESQSGGGVSSSGKGVKSSCGASSGGKTKQAEKRRRAKDKKRSEKIAKEGAAPLQTPNDEETLKRKMQEVRNYKKDSLKWPMVECSNSACRLHYKGSKGESFKIYDEVPTLDSDDEEMWTYAWKYTCTPCKAVEWNCTEAEAYARIREECKVFQSRKERVDVFRSALDNADELS